LEIKPRILKAFCAVVDTGSLALAGGQVSLSISAISRIISQLEVDLGVALFDRSERRLIPTEAGREFYRRAREALPLFDDLAAFGRRGGTGGLAPLRVAALSRHAETVVAPVLAGLLAEDSGFAPVQLDVHAQRDFAFSRLARPFDIGFGHLAGAHRDLVTECLALSPIVVAMAPGHPLARLDCVPMAALLPYPLIQLSRDTIIGAMVRETMTAASIDERPIAAVSHTYVALEMVRAGAGLHITDGMAALAAEARGVKLRPLVTERTVPILAFWPGRSDPPNPRALRLKQAVAAAMTGAGTVSPELGSPQGMTPCS
jgi:DNA-binding transcriptional LysR family regulator